MRRSTRCTVCRFLVFTTCLSFLIVAAESASAQDDARIAEINAALRAQGQHWVAGRTTVSQRPPVAGLLVPPDIAEREARLPIYAAPLVHELPPRWDWRENLPGVHPSA